MAFKLLDAATGTGPSSDTVMIRRGADDHTVQATFTGSPSAVTLDLEGRLSEDANWEVLASHSASSAELSAGGFMYHVANNNAREVRLNLSTFDDGTDLTAWYEDYPSTRV